MKSSKYTLSALATAAAVAFGGVAIAQVSSDTGASASAGTDTSLNAADTSISGSASGSSDLSSGTSASNSGSLDSGSTDTQTMGASGSAMGADSSSSGQLGMSSDTGSDDLLAPQADRG